MKKLKDAIRRAAPDVLLVAGAAAVAVGCGMIWLPMGVIAAGAAMIAFAIFSGPGGEEP